MKNFAIYYTRLRGHRFIITIDYLFCVYQRLSAVIDYFLVFISVNSWLRLIWKNKPNLFRIEYSVSPQDALRRSPKDCVMCIAERQVENAEIAGDCWET